MRWLLLLALVLSVKGLQLNRNTGSSIADLRGAILNLSRGKDNGIKATATERKQFSELAGKLEKKNPSRIIGSNSKLNGSWNLLYTSNTGSSAGKLGPFVGKVIQDIDVSSKTYTNYAIFGNGLFEASLQATWDDLDPKTWRVIFQTLKFKVLGLQLASKSLEGSVGIWRMTYLDDNTRVLYANSTENPSIENIYILAK